MRFRHRLPRLRAHLSKSKKSYHCYAPAACHERFRGEVIPWLGGWGGCSAFWVRTADNAKANVKCQFNCTRLVFVCVRRSWKIVVQDQVTGQNKGNPENPTCILTGAPTQPCIL